MAQRDDDKRGKNNAVQEEEEEEEKDGGVGAVNQRTFKPPTCGHFKEVCCYQLERGSKTTIR